VPPDVPLSIATALYRIAQEALHNAQQHGEGAGVRLALLGGENELRLIIEDKGPGFDRAEQQKDGLGLLSMQERVRLIGGTLPVGTEPGSGAWLLIRVPVAG